MSSNPVTDRPLGPGPRASLGSLFVLIVSIAPINGACGKSLDATETDLQVGGVDLHAPRPPELGNLDPRASVALTELWSEVVAAPYDAALRRAYAATLDAMQLDETALVAWVQAAALDPADARSQHHIGRLLSLCGRLPEAAEAFGRATRLNPDEASSFWRWGLVLLELGRVEEARLAFEGARTAAPRDPSGAAGLVRIALDEGELNRAEQLLTELLRDHPKDRHLHKLLARLKRRRGDEAAAALIEAQPTVATRCFRADPLERELSCHRIGFAEDIARARELLDAGRSDEALDLLEPLLAEDPAHLELEGLTVQALLDLGQTERARAILGESLIRGEQPRTRISLGFVHLMRKEYRRALECADAALAINPGLSNALFLRAKALFALHRSEESVQALEAAFASGEQSLEAHLLLGQSLAELEEYERALAAFEHATQTFPSSLQAWTMRCEMEIRTGATHAARRSLTEVAARDSRGIALPRLTRMIKERGPD